MKEMAAFVTDLSKSENQKDLVGLVSARSPVSGTDPPVKRVGFGQ